MPMAPMRGWAPANGWWWRPTKATAPSCACPPPWRWSPTPIPIIWIITAPSTRMRDAFQRFVENVPFYGFAVLCLDHPEVQAMVGRITDRRIITYGFSPQADARAVNVSFSEGASHFDVRLHRPPQGHRNAAGRASACPCRASTMSRTPWPPSWWRASWACSDDVIRKALAEFRRRRPPLHQGRRSGTAPPSSTITPTIPSRSPPRCKAARQAYNGPIVAVVQPHRYTRLRDTFEQFATCLNDADVAIIAPVYAAGEAADRRHQPRQLCRGACAPMATAMCSPSMAKTIWPPPSRRIVEARRRHRRCWAPVRSPPGCTAFRRSWRAAA